MVICFRQLKSEAIPDPQKRGSGHPQLSSDFVEIVTTRLCVRCVFRHIVLGRFAPAYFCRRPQLDAALHPEPIRIAQ